MSELVKRRHKIEIVLRGRALIASAKFESALMDIIYFTNSGQYFNGRLHSLDLKKLMFHQKIEKVTADLKKHHRDLFENNSQLLADLSQFKELRNQLAHCLISWPDDGLENIDIWDVAEDEDSFKFFSPTRHNVLELGDLLAKTIIKINAPLAYLQNTIRFRLSKNDPEFYAQLTQAAHNGGQTN